MKLQQYLNQKTSAACRKQNIFINEFFFDRIFAVCNSMNTSLCRNFLNALVPRARGMKGLPLPAPTRQAEIDIRNEVIQIAGFKSLFDTSTYTKKTLTSEEAWLQKWKTFYDRMKEHPYIKKATKSRVKEDNMWTFATSMLNHTGKCLGLIAGRNSNIMRSYENGRSWSINKSRVENMATRTLTLVKETQQKEIETLNKIIDDTNSNIQKVERVIQDNGTNEMHEKKLKRNSSYFDHQKSKYREKLQWQI